jgi:tRNA G46 methylase TrmB
VYQTTSSALTQGAVMRAFNFTLPDLIALYSEPYGTNMMRWRSPGADDKANHMERMYTTAGDRCDSILEVGCGTGTVLERLAARGLGTSFTGLEIGETRPKATVEGGACD